MMADLRLRVADRAMPFNPQSEIRNKVRHLQPPDFLIFFPPLASNRVSR